LEVPAMNTTSVVHQL